MNVTRLRTREMKIQETKLVCKQDCNDAFELNEQQQQHQCQRQRQQYNEFNR